MACLLFCIFRFFCMSFCTYFWHFHPVIYIWNISASLSKYTCLYVHVLLLNYVAELKKELKVKKKKKICWYFFFWNLLFGEQQQGDTSYSQPQSKERKRGAADLEHDCSVHRFSPCGIDLSFIQGCAAFSEEPHLLGFNWVKQKAREEKALQRDLDLWCFFLLGCEISGWKNSS